MAGETSQTNWVGFLKPRFGKLQALLAEESRLQKYFEFEKGTLLGSEFWEPVQVKAPHGITALGSAGAVVSLNQARPSQIENAKIPPSAYQLNDFVSTQLLDRSGGAGEKAFGDAAEYCARQLALNLRRYVEASMLHGQSTTGYGVVASLSSQTLTLTDGTFGPGWLGFTEGMNFDVFQSDASTVVQAGLVCTAVDVNAGTITFTGTATNTGTAGNIIVPAGFLANGGAWSDMAGVCAQLSLTTGSTGAAFNVSKTYSLWKGNTITSAGNFSISLLLDAAQRAANRGYNGKLLAVMAPKAWRYLSQANIAQQVFNDDKNGSKTTSGTDSIEIKHDGITIEVMSHSYMKPNTMVLLAVPHVKRIGSVDISLNKPGTETPFMEVSQTTNSVMFAARTDQAVFIERPAYCTIVTGITYA